MPKTIEEQLRAYFRDQRPPGVVSAYLFGSHAENRAHRESDVDVGVLLDRELHPRREDRFRVRVRLGSELIHAVHRNEVDVVVLNDAPPLLGRRIVTEGRRIYSEDLELDLEFVRNVQIRAADLKPFLERMRSIKIETLRR
ncbi:MAG: type VII toxin-antitoxin system MntA family adenylyltransferase antitoxin [Gemmatimonadota bacterium]